MRKIISSLFLFIACISTGVSQTIWKIDPVHSKVLFTVEYMMIGDVTGRFTEFDGDLVQKENDFSGSTVRATIKTASINTDNEKRDGHLRAADFFDAENNPEITFVSTSFEKINDKLYKVTGNLTLRGVSKAVILDVEYKGEGKDAWGNTRAGFKAKTRINRKDFGVSWNKALDTGGWLVSDNVDITLQIQMIKQVSKEE